jgi:hypothetical protein
MMVRPDAGLTRLNVASNRPNDRPRMAGLGRLAKDGVMHGRVPGSYRASDWPILCVPMRGCVLGVIPLRARLIG